MFSGIDAVLSAYTIDRSCLRQGHEADIRRAWEEAVEIARNAYDMLPSLDSRVKDSFDVFFNPPPPPLLINYQIMVKKTYDQISKADDENSVTTIHCGEDYFQRELSGASSAELRRAALMRRSYCSKEPWTLMWSFISMRQSLRDIVICPNSWRRSKGREDEMMLEEVRDAELEGIEIDRIGAISTILLHELVHLYGSDLSIVDHAYNFQPCRQLARDNPEKALANADNYMLLATDLYFTQMEFSTGKSRLLPVS
ncbi:MAG: hypothetical protein M1837_005161 [Sclerophora amabilis]|nr:MAG: hypothetical protein M1837_005161 [Sclerophora amabilis]